MSSSLPIHDLTVFQMSKMLRNLDGWLGKAEDYAKEKGFEVDVLLQARLAPDMFPLARQVQAACDNAKFGAARLSGIEAPAHPDEEKTIAELRERIRSALAYLETVTPEGLAESGDREIQLPFVQGKACKGRDYLLEFVMPNFYFHITTAYAILRHNGVPLGKYDYIGGIKMYDVETG
ncbi:MAG: DUF1993 domain-containing protein [Myxococcales bacterium]|nr:DUF1993 domain-containing protein [Myxococcales bacterium]